MLISFLCVFNSGPTIAYNIILTLYMVLKGVVQVWSKNKIQSVVWLYIKMIEFSEKIKNFNNDQGLNIFHEFWEVLIFSLLLDQFWFDKKPYSNLLSSIHLLSSVFLKIFNCIHHFFMMLLILCLCFYLSE